MCPVPVPVSRRCAPVAGDGEDAEGREAAEGPGERLEGVPVDHELLQGGQGADLGGQRPQAVGPQGPLVIGGWGPMSTVWRGRCVDY